MLNTNVKNRNIQKEDIKQTFLDRGNTLISDRFHNRVIEVDDSGNIVWEKTGMTWAADAERLDNGNTLIATLGGVFEVDSSGSTVWIKDIPNTLDVERLDNGNTLIVFWDNTGYSYVLEVDVAAQSVWWKEWDMDVFLPWDVERLDTGNTIIAGNGIAYEIDSSDVVVWKYTTAYNVVDVERLDNGNTLIVESNGNKVTEIDEFNNIIWGKSELSQPLDAERLDNGNTLIVESNSNRVIELDSSGSIVWQKDTNLDAPYDVERITLINHPPTSPTIDGIEEGKTGEEQEYIINSTDPEGDEISYCIDWGDESKELYIGPFPSGIEQTVSHIWNEEGTYTISVKVKDIHGAESEWRTLSVSMSKTKIYNPMIQLLFRIIERFPFMIRILNQIISIN
jgi:hypothetical protein